MINPVSFVCLEVVLQEHHQDRSRAAAETRGKHLSVYLSV